jgi:mono/diheme cytochrome c family protein
MKTSILILGCAMQALLWSAPPSAQAGKEAYEKTCKMCHGADGAGNPGMSKMLKVEFKHLGSPEVQKKSDDEIKKVITQGSGKMKPVASLSKAQIDDVVAYVRTLKP